MKNVANRVLLALSQALDVSLDYLLSERVQELSAVEFRKKSVTSAKERHRVEAQVIDQVERYLAIEQILDLPSHEWQEPFAACRLEHEEQAEDFALRLRKAWMLGEAPLLNVTELLEERGLKVLVLELPGNVSGLTCMVQRSGDQPALPVIVVNGKQSLERRRLTLAHELGHRLIHENSPVDEEKACNRFAGAFLVTQSHLVHKIREQRDGLSYEELMGLKRYFRISAAALLLRLRDIHVIEQSTLTYAFQTFAKGWRKNEPRPLDKDGEQPKRFARLCYRALAERYISPGKAVELLKQPMPDIERAIKGPDSHAHHHQ